MKRFKTLLLSTLTVFALGAGAADDKGYIIEARVGDFNVTIDNRALAQQLFDAFRLDTTPTITYSYSRITQQSMAAPDAMRYRFNVDFRFENNDYTIRGCELDVPIETIFYQGFDSTTVRQAGERLTFQRCEDALRNAALPEVILDNEGVIAIERHRTIEVPLR